MDPDGPAGTQSPSDLQLPGTPTGMPTPTPSSWQPGIPSIREHLPSLIFGGALPIGVYFIVRRHVHTDTQALIVAGCFSVGWILLQFIRQRTVDVVGAAVLVGFALGVISSTVFGGNDYMLKVRDGFFTLLFGIACVVTLFTHDRPAFFYVSRYLSAGKDPAKVSAFDELHELPIGRHTFRTLSVVWGIGLVVEASARLTLAGLLPTGTFIAVSPFITATVIGGLFAFTAIYTKRTQFWSAALVGRIVHDGTAAAAGPGTAPDPATDLADLADLADPSHPAHSGAANADGATGMAAAPGDPAVEAMEPPPL
ncbi:MAG TPA: VC0807 family protein [Acidimicrobiales bacterium]|nr:VC0807 family protein [Acidimicrobiales bacterium]